MKKESVALASYLKKRIRRIKTLISKPDIHFTIEDFHQLRVEIKKLKALLRLLDSCFKNFKEKKYFKPFKNIFDQAGKIRELQLEMQIIHKHDVAQQLKNYTFHLAERVRKEKEIFFSMNRKTSGELKKISKQIVPYINEVQKKDVENEIKKQRKEITSLLKRDTLKASEVHELRKELKRFYYIRKSLDLKDAKKAHTGKTLQKKMGKWHDYRVANRHLMQTANHHNVPAAEIPTLRKIAHQLLSESKTLYTKINTEKNKHIV